MTLPPRILLFFAILMILIALFSVVDSQRRESLEHIRKLPETEKRISRA